MLSQQISVETLFGTDTVMVDVVPTDLTHLAFGSVHVLCYCSGSEVEEGRPPAKCHQPELRLPGYAS